MGQCLVILLWEVRLPASGRRGASAGGGAKGRSRAGMGLREGRELRPQQIPACLRPEDNAFDSKAE